MDRIAVNPKIHFGKPCVAGTRITVQGVLELLKEGLTFAQIIQDYYPDLTEEDIRACLQYAIALVAAEDIHLASIPTQVKPGAAQPLAVDNRLPRRGTCGR